MTRTRAAVLLATAATGVTLLSACSNFGYGSSSSDNAPPPAANNGAPQQQNQTPAVSLIAKPVGQLGTVVTDAKGWTLYRFDMDTANPPASNCNDACQQKWPPVLAAADGRVKVSGVDANLVGTVTRKDGTRQVTINGWPVYRFAGDTAPGQAKGQGVGKTWFAVTPLGKKAAGTATGATPQPNRTPQGGATQNGYNQGGSTY